MAQRSTLSKSIDWAAFTSFVALVVVGWMMLYAAVYDPYHPQQLLSFSTEIGKQTIWIGISALAFVVIYSIDYTQWNRISIVLYGISMLLLLAVLVAGKEINGARAWFAFGGVSFQPSEIAKLSTALFLSTFVSGFKKNLKNRNEFLIALAIIALPILLIIMQPDAGSAMVFLSFFILFYRFGLSPNIYIFGAISIVALLLSIIYPAMSVIWFFLCLSGLILLLEHGWAWREAAIVGIPLIASTILLVEKITYPALGVMALPIVYFIIRAIRLNKRSIGVFIPVLVAYISVLSIGSSYLFNSVLRPHQQDRINVWLRPDRCDPHGSLYNIIQSKLAIGSGGLTGKGFLKGDMTKLNYVPEQKTDFIFCTVGEEHGFVGVALVIFLYVLLLYRMIVIAERAKSRFVTAYAYAISGILFMHFFFNIGMTMGLMPVIGIPLPFLSKGGSSLLVFTIMIAILLKMDIARYRK